MTDECRLARHKILLRRAAVIQRLNKEAKNNTLFEHVDNVIHLGAMLESLKQEISQFGGAPKGW